MTHPRLQGRRTLNTTLRRRLCASGLGILALSALVLLLAAGCNIHSPHQAILTGFAGDQACAECHPRESVEHQHSRHSVTFRTVDAANMGRYMPQPGPIPGTNLEIYRKGSKLAMGWQGRSSDALTLDYVLGSDKAAFTYIHMNPDHTLTQLRESYYPQSENWLSTPGTGALSDTDLGDTSNEDISRHCLGCHVTTLPADTITPERRFYGVGCEACHGPGQRHIQAVRSGATGDLQMQDLSKLEPTKLNRLCGRCHRNEDDVPGDMVNMTNRFEPFGLTRSKCYQVSRAAISCSSCHDPHANAAHDTKHYVEVCLSCHAVQAGFGPKDARRKTCPVNPTGKCIPCHMPLRGVSKDSPFNMTEHMIRIYRGPSRSGL